MKDPTLKELRCRSANKNPRNSFRVARPQKLLFFPGFQSKPRAEISQRFQRIWLLHAAPAAGEAFDKVAKKLGLGYPGGPIIERLAQDGDPCAVRFSIPRMGDGRPDFSFSGLKTAVSKHIRESGLESVIDGQPPSQSIKDLAASFQRVVVASLVGTMERVSHELHPKTLVVAGGVACNGALREASTEAAARLGVPVYFPSMHLSTDNAAMIAAAGTVKLEAGERSGMNLNADVMLRLQNIVQSYAFRRE